LLPFIHARQKRPAGREAGFSLVEIMVGMVIGMLGIIIVMQVFAMFEGQKRTTGGASEAQNNGAIALLGLVRDIQQTGYGISAYTLLGCDLTLTSGVTIGGALVPITINPPATVIPAGDANTSTLLVIYGNSDTSPEGISIDAQTTPVNVYQVGAPSAFYKASDVVIAAPQTRPATCSMQQDRISAIAAGGTPDSAQITVATGVAGVSQGTLYDLGQSPRIVAYAVRGGNLTACDYMVNNCGDATKTGDSTVWVPIANNIVSLQAQYGHDTLTPVPPPATQSSYIVDTYNQTTPTTACLWARTPAVRIALVARNEQYEKNGGTAASPTFATTSYPSWDGGTINLGANPGPTIDQPWKHYRYKVFQTTIAIRSAAWMGVQSGC
jgi:type IV pilus assembly protein PilW